MARTQLLLASGASIVMAFALLPAAARAHGQGEHRSTYYRAETSSAARQRVSPGKIFFLAEDPDPHRRNEKVDFLPFALRKIERRPAPEDIGDGASRRDSWIFHFLDPDAPNSTTNKQLKKLRDDWGQWIQDHRHLSKVDYVNAAVGYWSSHSEFVEPGAGNVAYRLILFAARQELIDHHLIPDHRHREHSDTGDPCHTCRYHWLWSLAACQDDGYCN